MPRPGHSLEALGIDLFTAVDALAEVALADSRQRSIHHLQQLPLVVALAEKKLFGVGAGSAIGDVLSGVFVGGATVRLGSGDRAPKFLLPCLEPLLKCF